MGQQDDDERSRLRARLRAERERLPRHTAESHAAQTCARLLRLPAYESAAAVVAYAASGNELDPAAVVAAAIAAGKAVYFPRRIGNRLEFLRAAPDSLRPASHGVLEPTGGEPLPDGAAGVVF